jgi:hypothetical protein
MNLQKLSREQLLEILNGVPELQVQLSHLCAKIASEIQLINSGNVTELPILRGDDKLFEKLMVVVKMRNDLSLLSLLPKQEDDAPMVSGKLKIKPGDNPYEHMIKQVKNGNSKN